MDSHHEADSHDNRSAVMARRLAALFGCALVLFGLVIVFSRYTPAKSTRYGIAPALYDADAMQFGVTIILVGMLPSALLFRSKAIRGLWAGLAMALMLLNVFFGGELIALLD